jgi:hypothetical protein
MTRRSFVLTARPRSSSPSRWLRRCSKQKLKVSEKEQTITAMQRQIEELRRKAEQGSQQLQGEVQELELEALLAGRSER